MTADTTLDWPKVLRHRIEQSGLSVDQFAERVVRRQRRTVQRWLSGESPIPAPVCRFLADPERSPWP